MFAGEFVVHCPRCAAAATVRRPWNHDSRRWEPATLVCGSCGHTRRQAAFPQGWAGPVQICVRQRCGRCGRWLHLRRTSKNVPVYRQVELQCDGCGATTRYDFHLHPLTVPRAIVDDVFGLPLWLQAPCAGHTLWALNADHLAYLKQFVAAELREHREPYVNGSVASRLPAWLKQARHRTEALRALARLEQTLPPTRAATPS